jgi:hypothetical protein
MPYVQCRGAIVAHRLPVAAPHPTPRRKVASFKRTSWDYADAMVCISSRRRPADFALPRITNNAEFEHLESLWRLSIRAVGYDCCL